MGQGVNLKIHTLGYGISCCWMVIFLENFINIAKYTLGYG